MVRGSAQAPCSWAATRLGGRSSDEPRMLAAVARGPVLNLASAPGDSNYVGLFDQSCNYLSASIVVCVIASNFGEPLGVLELLNKKLGRFDVSDEQTCRKIGNSIAMYLK